MTANNINIKLDDGGVKADGHATSLRFLIPSIPKKLETLNVSIPMFGYSYNHTNIFRIYRGGTDFENYTQNRAHEYIRKGSAIKFFDLALGEADIYPRFAPTMEWDIAAGHAILKALGGSVVNAHTNEPLTYNKESLYNPHFIAKTNAI